MLSTETFSRMLGGKQISIHKLQQGAYSAYITNYGAKIVSLNVPNNQGVERDIVLGFRTLEEWLSKETYFNAVIGRFANRIKDGRFMLDGREYQLAVNNGTNHLHGGVSGYNERVWDVVDSADDRLVLRYVSPDGEEGYPGTLTLTVTYSLIRRGKGCDLSVHYDAVSDAPTICGFTNHAYFNLKGEGCGDIRDHELTVYADFYTPTDDSFAPTGEVRSVFGTALDFRSPALIGERIDDALYAAARGLDHNWIIRRHNVAGRLAHAATLRADGVTMEVHTTLPGLQVYTGNWVEENVGKSGKKYGIQTAVCLEAQGFPNSPNVGHFPSPVLRPGERYDHTCVYRFVE